LKITRDRAFLAIISFGLAVAMWRYVKIEKMTDCKVDQNSHEDCLEMIKRLE